MSNTMVEITKFGNVYKTTIFRWEGDVFRVIGSAERNDNEAALEMVKKELESGSRITITDDQEMVFSSKKRRNEK